jgi:hypothetical protein
MNLVLDLSSQVHSMKRENGARHNPLNWKVSGFVFVMII